LRMRDVEVVRKYLLGKITYEETLEKIIGC